MVFRLQRPNFFIELVSPSVKKTQCQWVFSLHLILLTNLTGVSRATWQTIKIQLIWRFLLLATPTPETVSLEQILVQKLQPSSWSLHSARWNRQFWEKCLIYWTKFWRFTTLHTKPILIQATLYAPVAHSITRIIFVFLRLRQKAVQYPTLFLASPNQATTHFGFVKWGATTHRLCVESI